MYGKKTKLSLHTIRQINQLHHFLIDVLNVTAETGDK